MGVSENRGALFGRPCSGCSGDPILFGVQKGYPPILGNANLLLINGALISLRGFEVESHLNPEPPTL